VDFPHLLTPVIMIGSFSFIRDNTSLVRSLGMNVFFLSRYFCCSNRT